MPNYVSLTESQRRKISVFITESQQQAQLPKNDGEDTGSPGGSSSTPITGTNSISCKEIVQFCKTRFGLTISLSTASRLRSSAIERLSTELLNPSAKRHRSVKFPEFEKALVQELKALEQEQIQIQQEQERLNANGAAIPLGDPAQLPPVMTLTSEAAITQVAKGIAERMGISESELGLTSGWYHGFKRRHGIKHRQFKSRSNGSGASSAGGLGASSLGSIGGSGGSGLLETGDGSDGGDGDEEMEDVGQDSDKGKLGADESTANAVKSLRPGSAFNRQESADAGPSSFMDMRSLLTTEGSSGDVGSGSGTLAFANMTFTPKEPSSSSLSRRPEVKKYLIQNGQIGATKLPLVKELRKFLLAQTEIENGTSTDNGLLLGVGMPSLAPALTNPDNTVYVNNAAPALPAAPELSAANTLSLSGSSSMGGSGMASILQTGPQSALDLPADGLATMEQVLKNHQQAQQQVQSHEEQQQHQHAQQR
ncbi:hypothetical protein BGZ70_001247 [Mortierella alpina]|uniref:HTH CENPB-type domain-containing protein n=1 Tax=Mortierella alpina TaxID=64518 RepID=A0A9P6IWA1_MORAP|nr:hypothetical protein BGZ70_001247 [Mortierella alpina]